MIFLALWQMLAIVGASAAVGCIFGMLAMWHPGRPARDPGPDIALPPRTEGPRPAGYLPLANAGCYEPRTDWPEPDWPDSTFSEISAGWDRLERTVITQTQPFGRVLP